MSKLLIWFVFLLGCTIAIALKDGKYRPATEGTTTKRILSSTVKPHSSVTKKYKNEEIKSEKVIRQVPAVRRENRFDPRTGLPIKPPAPPAQPKALLKGKGTSIGRNDFKILKYDQEQELDGYRYAYETENGISAEEEGRIVELPSGEGLSTKGFFEYTGDDGALYRVDYVADDAGFVPQGSHIHPTPLHVVKLLKYLALNAAKK